MLQKNGFILLISGMCRLICNKNQIDMTISWGQYFSPLILDESWSHLYQNDPEGSDSENIKIFKKFKLEVGEISTKS